MGGKIKTFFVGFLLLFALIPFFAPAISAISKGYTTTDSFLIPGMVVSLVSGTDSDSSLVERANEENAQRIIGVATTVENSSITVASEGQNVFVESGGDIRAYVSDLNGEVKKGDQLTISPLGGMMSLPDKNSRIILGVALEDFPTDGYQTKEIDSVDGKKTIKIAQVLVNLEMKNIVEASQVDSSLERLGKSVAGKSVSEIRVIVALVIFLLVLVAEGGVLYGAISSAITSAGRNPLAGKIIKKQLLQVILVAFAVIIFGLLAIYFVLWA